MFGDVVRGYRRRVGLTQEELADKTGVSVRGIGKIEAGRTGAPRPATVRLLADAFGLADAERNRFYQAASPEKPDRPTPAAVPAPLPADVYGFTGRDEHVARLDTLLAAAAEQPTAVAISALSGAAGVGKTALAVHWAHRVRGRFPDGALYVNLHGFDRAGSVLSPAEAVCGFLDALDVPPSRIPAGLDAQAALYRSLLADRKMLVLLDNARDADQIRPLLPGAATCFILVTSRNQLTSLVAAQGAHAVPLDLLTHGEARDLLARRLGTARLDAEPAAVRQIVTRCAGLPLALSVVAARAATNPRLSMRALADELRDTRARLDALTAGDATTDVRAVLSWSYRAVSPDAARLFRLLGLHPGPDVSTAAAASLAGTSPAQVEPLLTELTRAHLLTEHTPGRYTFHDLLRAYAIELTHTGDTDGDRHACQERILDHYLSTAHAAALLLNPHREPVAPRPAAAPERLTNREQATAWFAREHPVVVAAARQASVTGFGTHTWQLAWTLWNYLDRRGHWHRLAEVQQLALETADRHRDRPGQAHARRALARAYTKLGRFEEAQRHYERALELCAELGDSNGGAVIHLGLAYVHEQRGDHEQALGHARHALDSYPATSRRVERAWALNSVGYYHTQLGDHRKAVAVCREALTLLQDLGDRYTEASVWDSLGSAHRHLGDHAQALTCYTNALALYRELAFAYQEAETLTHLGDAYHADGNRDAACGAYQQAAAILDRLRHPDADTVRGKLQTVMSLPGRPPPRGTPDGAGPRWTRRARPTVPGRPPPAAAR